MFVANFLTGPGTDKTPYNVKLTFGEYIHGKWNSKTFLEKLSNKHGENYLTDFYYIGVRYVK
tara:strand:- start:619 stop:804 length:186 start_codon:yes stop_codon:yes gene_type:complete